MSQGERKAKRKKARRWKIFMMGIVFIFLFFRGVPSMFASAFKTVLPERHIIKDGIETKAIIIRDERLYKASAEGRIENLCQQGERVPVGGKVARIILPEDTTALTQQLKEIDHKIGILEKTKIDESIIKGDLRKKKEIIQNIIEEIQYNIFEGDYQRTEILKEKLLSYNTNPLDGNEDTLIGQSLDKLKDKKKLISEQISSNIMEYSALESGIVSYIIDGYEELYSTNYMDDYEYSDFMDINDKRKIISNNDGVKIDEPIFKIIDNFEWYMIIKIEEIGDIIAYDVGDSILLVGEEIEDELTGHIERISKDGNRGIIIVKFNRDFHYYYDKRDIEVEIIRYKYEGYKIPSSTITDNEGITGVYIKEISGIVRFRPVEIIKEEDEYTYVSIGDKNYCIDMNGGDESVRTIRQFDEILLNTTNIKEGMIIN